MKTSNKVKLGLAILGACTVLTAMAQYPYCFGLTSTSCPASMDGCNLDYSYGDTMYQTMADGQTFATYCPVGQCGYDCDGTIYYGVSGITGGTLCDGDGGGCDTE